MNKRPPVNRILLAVGAIAFVIGLVLGKDQGDAETTSNTISAILLTLGFLMVVTYWPDLSLWLPRQLGML